MYIEFLSHELPFNTRSTVVSSPLGWLVPYDSLTTSTWPNSGRNTLTVQRATSVFFGMNNELAYRCIDSLTDGSHVAFHWLRSGPQLVPQSPYLTLGADKGSSNKHHL